MAQISPTDEVNHPWEKERALRNLERLFSVSKFEGEWGEDQKYIYLGASEKDMSASISINRREARALADWIYENVPKDPQ